MTSPATDRRYSYFWICISLCVCLLGRGGVSVLWKSSDAVASAQTRKLYSIKVQDAEEAELIQQELKLKPELLAGTNLYYYGDDSINRRLTSMGYSPVVANADEVFTRVTRIRPPKDEALLRKAGAVVLLRERDSWFVRTTVRQLNELERSGLVALDQRPKEPVPRRIQVVLSRERSINEQIGGRVEVNVIRNRGERLTIIGEAFDDAIDELRARGLQVQILADYPGVVR